MPTCYIPPRCPSCGSHSSSKCDCPMYKVILGDVFSYFVPKATHGLQDVHTVSVFNYDGNQVILQTNVAQNKDVQIYSNVSLINSTLIIY